MKNDKEPQLLNEFLGFRGIFGLSFLQSIVGGGGEGVDPEYEEFLAGQENLEPIIDKIKEMEQDDMKHPEGRSFLSKAICFSLSLTSFHSSFGVM